MKKDLIYLAVIAALVVAVFILFNLWADSKIESNQRESIIKEKEGIIKYYKTENGKLAFEKDAAQITTKELSEFYGKQISEIKRELGINRKEIRAIVQAGFEAHGQGEAQITPIDTDGAQPNNLITGYFRPFKIRGTDGYIYFEVTADGKRNPFTASYRDSLTIVMHNDRKWFLGADHLKASGYLANKNAKITSATTLLTGKSLSNFSLGGTLGYSAILHDQQVLTGWGATVGLQYRLQFRRK